jgi:hypothetical protein
VVFRIPIKRGVSSFNDFPLECSVREGSSNGAENIGFFKKYFKIKKKCSSITKPVCQNTQLKN